MIIRSIANHLRRLRANERGSVSATMGILMVPLVGALGLGFEVSNWYRTTRSMQNAADAAVIAAATNAGANYDVEAKAVAATYGFVNGTNQVTVLASNAATCPDDGSTTCYSVTISGFVPLLLSQVMGFTGDTNANGSLEKKLSSASVAKAGTQVCILALASSGTPQGIRSNGAPSSALSGCNVQSNTGAQCNGSNLGANIGFAHGTSSGCGAKPVSNVPVKSDPFAYIANDPNFPKLSASGCSGPPTQETPAHGNTPATTTVAANLLSGSSSLTAGNNFRCGDVVLSADVTLPTGAVLVIEHGGLDLNGFKLSGSGVTLVFSGDNTTSGVNHHAPFGAGTLDIAAPTSGLWSGVAIYQDPNLNASSALDVSAAGNTPTWLITGLVYMPHASITLSGAIDHATGGQHCFVLVVDNILINGTGGIAQTDTGHCQAAGLTMPTAASGVALVL